MAFGWWHGRGFGVWRRSERGASPRMKVKTRTETLLGLMTPLLGARPGFGRHCLKRGRVKVRVRQPVFLEADYTRSPIRKGYELMIFVTLVSVECVMTVTVKCARNAPSRGARTAETRTHFEE